MSPGLQMYESRLLLSPVTVARSAAALLPRPAPEHLAKLWDGGFAVVSANANGKLPVGCAPWLSLFTLAAVLCAIAYFRFH